MTLRFIDTNILLYSISRLPSEAEKRARAIAILDDEHGALSAQVLQEFFVQATREASRNAIPSEEAIALIEDWTRFPIQEMSLGVLRSAFEIHLRHRFSYWDSAIIAAAAALGCDTLLTEDLSHGQVVNGVRILNPFLPPP